MTLNRRPRTMLRTNLPDEITVEELSEDDVGYASDMETLYPDELEEVQSGTSDTEEARDTDVDNDMENEASDATIVRRLQHLRCHEMPPSSSTARKRAHSETIYPELGRDDTDQTGSDTLARKSRRLRGLYSSPSPSSDYVHVPPILTGVVGVGSGAPAAATASNTSPEGDGMDMDSSATSVNLAGWQSN